MDGSWNKAGHTSTERHNPCPKVAGVERHVNAGEWYGSKAAFKPNIPFSGLLRLSLGITFFEDLAEDLLDLFFPNLSNELLWE
jgi:hypothetical protein